MSDETQGGEVERLRASIAAGEAVRFRMALSLQAAEVEIERLREDRDGWKQRALFDQQVCETLRNNAEAAEAQVAKAEDASRRTGDHNVRLLCERDEALARVAELEERNAELRQGIVTVPKCRQCRDTQRSADRLAEAVAWLDSVQQDPRTIGRAYVVPWPSIKRGREALTAFRSTEPAAKSES